MTITVSAAVLPGQSRVLAAHLEEWDGWEISTHRFGFARLFDNGCSQISAHLGRHRGGWQIWAARDREPFWDDDLQFIWTTLLRLVSSTERQMGKLLTFALPDDVLAEIKAARDERWAGEGI